MFRTMKEFPKIDWNNFPTNEHAKNVKNRLALDCKDSDFFCALSGYSGLDQVIWFITRKANSSKIRIVFGHEPSISSEIRLPSPRKISEEMRDYWLDRGFSPSNNSTILEAINAIKQGRVEVRIHKERFLHAKAYITSKAAIFGSSNFSKPGLVDSRELNGRFQVNTESYDTILEFFEGCWDRSDDYNHQLLELLETLLKNSTWQDALARGCAALLEGDWAKQLIPPNLMLDFDRLWPHQRQGVAQALTVLENQGAVVIADPTGSGKTNQGGWLIRMAQNRMLSKGGEMATNLTPTMVCPSSVTKNWYQIFDTLGILPQVLPMGILSSGTSESSINRLKQIEKTNLLSVDEIHNFYGQRSSRTKNLAKNLAEARIFLTATPINKEFKDLLKLMKLLGTQDLDGQTFSKLRKLEDEVNHPEKKRKENARREANRLIQRFMVRRTREDLRRIVQNRQEEYMLPSGRVANYPDYIAKEYSLESSKDEHIVEQISELAIQLKGIARITKLRQTKDQKNLGITEKVTLDRILKSQPALSNYHIWKMLDSSVSALHEHLLGTEFVEKNLGLKTGKDPKSFSEGVINKLKRLSIPKWEFSESFRDSKEVPSWLIDEEDYNSVRENEINLYNQIADLSSKLSDRRLRSKVDCIAKAIKEKKKVLAFDTSNVTLIEIQKFLLDRDIEAHCYIGSSKGTKTNKVKEAEELFGLKSDDKPRVGLLSDMMSEGINLQGTSVLVHLTTPSVIRLAEQRVGRVDRMNTNWDEIEIFYPERDSISSKMKSYLSERNNLVGDVIGSNIKLPGDDDHDFDDMSEEGEMTSSEMTEKMFSERNGLFDAFHEVRMLIGENGLISNEDYEMMRTSKARVQSYVAHLRSDSPWCFLAIESSKSGPPLWIYLDYTNTRAKANYGITNDTTEICNELRKSIIDCENIVPSERTDKFVKDYLKHISKHQFRLLPPRRQSMLQEMRHVLQQWIRKIGHASNIGTRLEDLRDACIGRSDYNFDMRIIASKWIEYRREQMDALEILLRKRGRKKKNRTREILVENPPLDLEVFLEGFEKVNIIPELDSRIISMIAGIPASKYDKS